MSRGQAASRIKVSPGEVFGFLTVVSEGEKLGIQRRLLVRCVCGVEKLVLLRVLRLGTTVSCGCYNRVKDKIHGLRKEPEYNVWRKARLRCYDPENSSYADYGGRGIRMDQRWLDSVEQFIADVGRRPSPQHTLDRIDTNGNYEPGNTRWATRKEQARNRRKHALFTLGSETKLQVEWAEQLSIPEKTLHTRRKLGWSDEEALTIPVTKADQTWRQRRRDD